MNGFESQEHRRAYEEHRFAELKEEMNDYQLAMERHEAACIKAIRERKPMPKFKAPNEKERKVGVIELEGWFFAPNPKLKDSIKSAEFLPAYLDPNVFKFSKKAFVIAELGITPIRRLTGYWYNPVQVQGVVEKLSDHGSLMPCFIEEKHIKKLSKIIKLERNPLVLKL